MHLVKTKTRTLASSRFEAMCNMLSSAVDRREVLGVAVGEWGDIVFLQCHSCLARGTATTLAPLLNKHSALCAEFGVSAIYGDTHHNRCFATLTKSGAANEEVY